MLLDKETLGKREIAIQKNKKRTMSALSMVSRPVMVMVSKDAHELVRQDRPPNLRTYEREALYICRDWYS